MIILILQVLTMMQFYAPFFEDICPESSTLAAFPFLLSAFLSVETYMNNKHITLIWKITFFYKTIDNKTSIFESIKRGQTQGSVAPVSGTWS